MNIQSSFFGKTKTSEDVTKYVLTNDSGCSIGIINYGGIITDIHVPNKNGVIENVVFGHDNVLDYEEHSPYFGCITGRFAGRISNATFTIGQVSYGLPKNNGVNCLHGGVKGLDKVIWSATEITEKESVALSLNYLSPHLEEGFPGNLDLYVMYKWNNDNQLSISYMATTDQETLLTLTNHTYFNLSGNLSGSILDHVLQIDADRFVEISPDAIPCGISEVEGTPFDFREGKKIGKDIGVDFEQLKNGLGYDHPFILNGKTNPQVSLCHEASGRKITVSTDETCLVCYTGNHLTNEMKIAGDTPIQHRGAVCLETQYYPDNANFDLVPTYTLKANETYKHKTVFEFSVI
ncbi:MAG: galactose mutarotase [Vallitaleaceae bacterium]|nr:galactose mutarotase [Vallitaleaceae bacterium]